MRILGIYAGVFPQFIGFVSGGERHFIEVCKRMESHGFRLDVLTTKLGFKILKAYQLKSKGYKIGTLGEGFMRRCIVGLAFLYAIRTLKSIIYVLKIDDRYDIMCTCTHFLYDTLPACVLSRRNPGSKVIVYLHHMIPPPLTRSRYNPLPSNFLIWILQSLSLALIKRRVDIVFMFDHSKNRASEVGIPDSKLQIMHNGLDLKEILCAKPGKEEYDACFLGRLNPLKGIYDIVPIWKYVCKNLPNARLAIIGSESGEYVTQFRSRIKAAGLEKNVVFLGALSEKEKYAVLKSCKIFIFPSYEEGWGIPVYEAMACDLPVVAYDLPAYKNLEIDAFFKIQLGDWKATSETLLRLLLDEQLRARLSNIAREAAIQFDWNNVVEAELKVIAASIDEI